MKEHIIIPQIMALKEELSASDYKAIKYAEGLITTEEYEPIKAERQAIREQINALEKELAMIEELA